MKKLTIIFIMLLSFSFVAEAQLNINHFIRVGRTRISIGNYTGAIEYFNIVIEFKPYLPEAYLYRGIAKHSLEDYRGAIEDYDKAIEIKPYYPMAYNNRGMAYHNLRRYDKAIEDYNRALEFDPDDETIYNNRGIAKLALKNLEGAIEDYNKALEINPKSTHALMNRSNAKIVSGDIEGAIKDLNQVIIIRPHYAAAYLNRGLARFELEDYASALRDYDQAIRFDPENALAFNNRAIVKHKLEDYEGAIMDYDMAIKLNPEMASAYFNRAMAREILNMPGYENDYRIAARLNPQFDLSKRRIDSEQLAQQQKQQSGNTQQQQQNTNNQQQNPNTQPGQSSTQIDAANDTEKAQEEVAARAEKEREEERRRRQIVRDLVVEDTRDLPEEAEVDDGRIQNKNIAIELQPLFFISAFEKNAVDYDRFQYYNLAIDDLNAKNNYNPLLSITNKPVVSYQSVFENFILFFNEKIDVQPNASNYLNRGIFYSLTGDYNSALEDMNKAISLDDRLGVAYFSRANCVFKMHEQIELISGSQSNSVSISIDRKTQATGDEVSEASALDYNQILEDYQIALFLNPNFFFGYYNRAYIKLRLNDYRGAIEDLNRAIDLEPEFAEAFFNRGLTKIYLNDIEGGALDLSRAGELGIEGAYNIIKRYCN
ncbi:tetratricopeptide repeat protein [Maribellus sediminis]|uniref:tetratricopeptide repeat protein n=1 Tax=Maribellus sediminis TaxID=2696285 RepID=UPI0014310D55|nr:tetratricopeptide repeat protein [Maribellus sediminis]